MSAAVLQQILSSGSTIYGAPNTSGSKLASAVNKATTGPCSVSDFVNDNNYLQFFGGSMVKWLTCQTSKPHGFNPSHGLAAVSLSKKHSLLPGMDSI